MEKQKIKHIEMKKKEQKENNLVKQYDNLKD